MLIRVLITVNQGLKKTIYLFLSNKSRLA